MSVPEELSEALAIEPMDYLGIGSEASEAIMFPPPVLVDVGLAEESGQVPLLALTFALERNMSMTMPIGIAEEINSAFVAFIAGSRLMLSSEGELSIEDEEMVIIPEFQIQVLDPIIERGPGVVTVTIDGGIAEAEVEFYIDGDLAWTTTLDSSGALTASSIGIYVGAGADVGVHDIEARQTDLDSNLYVTAATYEVLFAPFGGVVVAAPDADPVIISAAISHGVNHWVLQDLLAGGLGSYVLPINPSEMTSPHWENNFSVKRTTSKSGQFHIFQVGKSIPEWKFSGYAPTQAMVEKLEQYAALNRRFYLIDHRNRAWKVVFTGLDLKARLRHVYNGETSDWGHDYEVTALVLDQEWWEPV